MNIIEAKNLLLSSLYWHQNQKLFIFAPHLGDYHNGTFEHCKNVIKNYVKAFPEYAYSIYANLELQNFMGSILWIMLN